MEATQPTEGVWPGKIKSWEIAEVEAIKQLKLVVWWDVTGNGWVKTMKFEQFFLKKDGTQNKKTYDTLKACGFNSNDVADLLNEDALDTDKTFDLTIESSTNEGKTYWHVEWVNSGIQSKGAIKDKTTLKGHNLSKLNSFLGTAKPQVRNHAPQSSAELDDFLNS